MFFNFRFWSKFVSTITAYGHFLVWVGFPRTVATTLQNETYFILRKLQNKKNSRKLLGLSPLQWMRKKLKCRSKKVWLPRMLPQLERHVGLPKVKLLRTLEAFWAALFSEKLNNKNILIFWYCGRNVCFFKMPKFQDPTQLILIGFEDGSSILLLWFNRHACSSCNYFHVCIVWFALIW